MKNLIAITIFVLIVQGCATSYQKKGFTGGFSETQLDENVFSVSFRGNGYTDRERVADFTLLRSAELTLSNGYQYFAVIDSNSYTKQNAYTTPTHSNTTASAYASGNYAYGNATTTTTGGQTFLISKPSASNTIVCFKEKPESIFTYNANFIYKNVRQKYKIKDDVTE